MLNQFNGLGNLTRDIELRYTQGGKAVTTLGLAINRKYGNKEETLFIDVDCWDKLAELVNNYCQKGSKVFVSGRIVQDSWDQDGVKRTKHKVVADTIQFVGKTQRDTSADTVNVPDDGDVPF